MSSRAKKICLLGDFAVGKTSLVRRYTEDSFSPDYKATLGVRLHPHRDRIETEEGVQELDIVIWDIEGGTMSSPLLTDYMLGASGALIVGDLARKDALTSMAGHADHFQARLPGRPMIFALNKADLVASDEAPLGPQLSERFGAEVIKSSAATGEAVPALFKALGRRILEIGI